LCRKGARWPVFAIVFFSFVYVDADAVNAIGPPRDATRGISVFDVRFSIYSRDDNLIQKEKKETPRRRLAEGDGPSPGGIP
jgi:hypothetical protein